MEHKKNERSIFGKTNPIRAPSATPRVNLSGTPRLEPKSIWQEPSTLSQRVAIDHLLILDDIAYVSMSKMSDNMLIKTIETLSKIGAMDTTSLTSPAKPPGK